MGVGRIFSSGGPIVDFSRRRLTYFSRGDKSGEISFYPLETKNNPFLLKTSQKNVKFQNPGRGQSPLPPFQRP